MARPKSDSPTYSLCNRAGKYYVQWWNGKQSKRISLGTTDKEAAKRALRQFLAGVDSPAAPDSPLISDILAGYIKDRTGRVKNIASIQYACAALNEHIGDLTPDHITTQVSRKYAQKRREQGRRGATGHGKPLSDGTIIKEIVTLRAALRWAVNERWIQAAPKVEAPTAPHAKERWLTRAEAKRLLEATETPHIRLFIQLALYTGARTSAILELQWEQVDFERNVINYGAGAGNKKRAIVPIIPELREVLWEAATIRTRDCVIEFRGGPVVSIRHAFRERVKAAGLKDVTPHTLRHTCATWLVMRGVPFEMVAKFLGNSVDMIERVYGHHSPDWLRKAATALSGFAE